MAIQVGNRVIIEGMSYERFLFASEDRHHIIPRLQILEDGVEPGQPPVDVQFAIEEAVGMSEPISWNPHDALHGIRPEPKRRMRITVELLD